MNIKTLTGILSIAVVVSSTAFSAAPSKDATKYTKDYNQKLYQYLNFEDKQDYEDAKRGLIKEYPQPNIKDKDGKVIYDISSFDFIKQNPSPDSVNPSLWRVSQLNINNGLYKVTEGIYQIRGLDLSNMTIVETDTSLILIDPLISIETAKAGLVIR